MGGFLATHHPAHGQENRSAAALPTDPLSHRHECAGMDQPLPSRGKEVMSAELIDTDEIAPNAPAQPMTTCATNCWSAPPHPLALLRARRERPRCRRTADKRYEIAPLHC
jgi:hypothetical protein